MSIRSSCAACTAGLALAVPAAADVVVPPEGVELTQIHVPFHWTEVEGVDQYQLQVWLDRGSPSPFIAGGPVVDVVVDGAAPRATVTVGLEFGDAYAWRVRGLDPAPLAWGPTHRFGIAAPPQLARTFAVTEGPGTYEPGYTLFADAFGLAVVIDRNGDPIWFQQYPSIVHDIRLLPNGRILVLHDGRAWIKTTNGQACWGSPDGEAWICHHEASPMPNGNVLTILYDTQGPRDLLGDIFVEFDQMTNEVVWSWNTFDHWSTDDIDPLEKNDWTHCNAVVYNPADDSVYVSCRHLSRISRIDYSTGDIVYNMGADMPSGDAHFGDNLFSFQHAPQLLPNGNMMVYDNGNRRDGRFHTPETGESRAIELAFVHDPETGDPVDAFIAWEWEVPQYTPFVCDADRLPGGNTLVCTGPGQATYEVAPDGSVVWSINHDGFFLVLRAERIPEFVLDAPADADGDGVADMVDNCPDWANPDQEDCNGDGFGDLCAIALGLEADVDRDGTPDACDPLPSICLGDVDSSGAVDVGDLVLVMLDWGTDGSTNGADIDQSGLVDVDDLVLVIASWGACP